MRFFVAKLTYLDGTRSHPWSLFASSYAHAVERLEIASTAGKFSAIALTESRDGEYLGRDLAVPDDAIIEHTDIGTAAVEPDAASPVPADQG